MPPASKPAEGVLTDAWGRRNNRKYADRVCPNCGRLFKPLKSTTVFCSRPCMWANNGGHNRKPEYWWVNRRGYIEGRIWIDGERISVRQHRYLMEQHIGRPLSREEDVHHVNGVKSDNRIENLRIVPHDEHTTITNSGRSYRRGYKLDLTPEQREARADRMRRMRKAQSD